MMNAAIKLLPVFACATLQAWALDLSGLLPGQTNLPPGYVWRSMGSVVKPGSQKGWIEFVNAQSAVKQSVIERVAENWAKFLHVAITVTNGGPITASGVLGAATGSKANLTLYVIDDKSMPTSILYAPESTWCILNVRPIFADNPDEKLAAMRASQETTRAFALLSGAMNSGYPDSLMTAVTKPQMLDFNDSSWQIPIDVIERFKPWYAARGITPYRIAPYIRACQEGWAPAPTNDAQKAVWERIHAIPTKPVKITYDKAAQKPVVK